MSFDSINKLMQWQSEKCQKAIAPSKFSLANLFLFPNQVAYVVECRSGKVIEATPRFGKIFGYDHLELNQVQQLYEPILKTDLAIILTHTHQILDWIFKNQEVPAMQDGGEFRYNIKTKPGKVVRILRQTASCIKVNGMVTHTLGVLTNISHFDATRKPMVRALGPTAHYFSESVSEINNLRRLLSTREVEILKLLAKGMTSRYIANGLNISSHTVDTHRRNMLHKLEADNTIEMLYLARTLNLI